MNLKRILIGMAALACSSFGYANADFDEIEQMFREAFPSNCRLDELVVEGETPNRIIAAQVSRDEVVTNLRFWETLEEGNAYRVTRDLPYWRIVASFVDPATTLSREENLRASQMEWSVDLETNRTDEFVVQGLNSDGSPGQLSCD